MHGMDRLIYSTDSEKPLTENIGATTVSNFRLYYKAIGAKISWTT